MHVFDISPKKKQMAARIPKLKYLEKGFMDACVNATEIVVALLPLCEFNALYAACLCLTAIAPVDLYDVKYSNAP